MKNRILSLMFLFTFLVPVANIQAFAGTVVNISGDGSSVISGVKVMQLAGSTIFARMYWGDSYVRLTIKTNSNTKFYRATGEVTGLSEITEGNMLDITGSINSGSDVLTITASTIKNQSVQKKQNVFSGKVSGVDLPNNSFLLNTTKYGIVTVKTNTTTQFIKGSRTLDLAHVVVGDTITKTSGDFDIPTNTLTANSVVTYIAPDYYKSKNFQGTLKEIGGTALPTTLQVLIDGKTYTVNVTANASILNKAKGPIMLNRFVVGDTIRVYGAIREVDEPIMDVEVVRNINL
jgi:hypothetical protein